METQATNKQLRSFGLLVGGVFGAIGLFPLVWHGTDPRQWALIVAALLLVPAVVWPPLLKPAFRVWMAIGLVLGWINTRIILGLIFFLMVTPIGLIMRLLGKDPMQRRFDRDATTYRVEHKSRDGQHMHRQF